MKNYHRIRVLSWLFLFGLFSFTTVFGKESQDIPNQAQNHFNTRRNVMNYIEVSGRITFKGKAPETIPPNSQLNVKLIDIRTADASHIELASILVDLSSYENDSPVFYNLTSKKPSDLHDMHSITAVLNMGWTPKGGENDEWLRHGDFHTTYSFMVNVTSGTDKFVRDIEMEVFTRLTSASVLWGNNITSVATLLLLVALFLLG